MSKNKLIIMIVSLIIFVTSGNIVTADTLDNDAYSDMYFMNADDYSDTLEVYTDLNSLGIAELDNYILYKNVDFGEYTAEFIDISYAVVDRYSGGTMNIYVDSISAENLCAIVISESTGSWTEFSSLHTQLLQKLTGRHDIYFKVISDVFGNLRSFKFSNNSAEREKAEKEFTDVINSGNVESYPQIFESYADVLEMDMTEFNGGEDFIYSYIGQNVPYSSFSSLRLAMNDAIKLWNINSAESAEMIKRVIDSERALLSDVPSSFKEEYEKISKTDVCFFVFNSVKQNKVYSKADLSDVFCNAVCRASYLAVDNAEKLEEFLKKYSSFISIASYSDFITFGLKSQENILNSVLGTEFDMLSDSLTAAIIDEQKRIEETTKGAYDEYLFYDADDMSERLNKITSLKCVGNTGRDLYIKFNELNFGTVGATAVDFKYGTLSTYTGEVRFYVDSISAGNLIATLVTKDTGDWHNWEIITTPLNKRVTGVHDVYIVFGGVIGDVKSMQFYTSKIVNVSDISVKLYKSDTETENISEADKIAVSGSVEVINDGSASASLIVNVYDENMTPLMPYMISKSVLQSGAENILGLENAFSNGISPVSANAFIIDDSYIIYGKPTFLGAYIPEKSSSEKPIDVRVADTKISVFGKADSEYLAVGVREKSKGRDDFADYEFISPIKTIENSYAVSIEAPTGMRSGEYIVVMFDGNGSFSESEFSFVSETDIKNALAEINAAKATAGVSIWQAVKSIAEANESFLGIDTAKAEINPEWIYTNLANGIPYEKLSTFQENFGFFTALSAIPQSDDAEKVIDENLEVLGISSDNCAEKYRKNKKIKSGAAKRAAAALKKSLTNTKSEFLKLYRLSACFEVMHNAVSWGEIDEVFSDFNGDLTLSSYNSYKNMSSDKKAQVCRALLNLSESELSADGIRNKFETAYKSAQAANNSGGKTSSGGGGGGGSSFTVKEPLPKTEEEENAVKFTDIDDCTWAKKQIVEFYKNGFINGKSEESFCPYDNVTRAEFIKILCLSLGISADGDCSFSDLSREDWSYPYISAAYNKGIVGGYEDGSVRGASSITREEMAVMAYRAALISGISIGQVIPGVSFVDGEKISTWAYEAIMVLARGDILHGTGGDLFCPEQHAGRAETVVFLSNLRAAGDFNTESKD